MGSLAGLNKNLFIFLQKASISAIFGYLGPHSNSIFSTHMQNFKKSLVTNLREFAWNIVLNFERSISKNVKGGGASRFASQHFPWSVILASCNFVGRQFVASHACSIVYFHSY